MLQLDQALDNIIPTRDTSMVIILPISHLFLLVVTASSCFLGLFSFGFADVAC